MKILVVRFSSIGDIVLTTPVVRCLQTQLPHAEIHYLTKSSYAGLLANNPYITKVWSFKDDLSITLKTLKKERFDYVIDLHNNLRSKRVRFTLRVPSKVVDKLNWQKWLLVRFGINRLPKLHIVDRYMATVKHLNVSNDTKGLDFFIPEDAHLPDGMPERYVGFAIGGQHQTKKLPVHQIIAICNSIQSTIVLIGGKEDQEIGNQVSAAAENVISVCGEVSIDQSALILKQSTAVISHDTGMMHIAAALKKRVISVWGNTVPDFGMYPYLPDPSSQQFEVVGLSCRPCSKIGYKACPKGHFKCMENQDVSAIAKAADH